MSGLPHPYDVLARRTARSGSRTRPTTSTVRNYTADGTLRLILGTPGVSGADWDHFRGRRQSTSTPPDGAVYILDVNRPALRIRPRRQAAGGLRRRGSGHRPDRLARVSLAVSPDGTLYIGEMGNSRIEVFKPGLTGWTQLALPGFNHPCNQTDTLRASTALLCRNLLSPY